MRMRFLFFVFVVVSIVAGPNATRASDFHVRNDGDLVELACYHSDNRHLVDVAINLESNVVVKPYDLSVGRVLTGSGSQIREIILYREGKMPEEFVTISSSGEMSDCTSGYFTGACQMYRCYRKNQTIF